MPYLLQSLVLTLVFAQQPATEESRRYETSFEIAEAAEVLDSLSRLAGEMRRIDEAQRQVFEGNCLAEYDEYRRSTQEVQMLKAREDRGETLTQDEKDWQRQQVAASAEGRKRLDECVESAAAAHPFLGPRNLTTNDAIVAAYLEASEKYRAEYTEGSPENPTLNRLRAQMPEMPDQNSTAQKLREMEEKWNNDRNITVELGYRIVAKVTSARDAEFLRGDGNLWKPVQKGAEVQLQDQIRTQPNGRARIEFLDKDGDRGPTVVNVGSYSRVAIVDLVHERKIGEEEEWQRVGLMDVLRGAVRVFTKNWKKGSYSVRTGTSLCGIRGTDVAIRYEPDLDRTTYRLFEGVVEIRTDSGETRTLQPGFEMTVTAGRISAPTPMGADVQ